MPGSFKGSARDQCGGREFLENTEQESQLVTERKPYPVGLQNSGFYPEHRINPLESFE